MSKSALVLLTEGFEDIETVTPVDLLRRGGVDVTIASIDGHLVRGSRGVTIAADAILSEIDTAHFDALVIPGGPGAKRLAASAGVASLIKDFNAHGKIIAAICASPAIVLSPLGILDGKRATCFPACENDLSPKATLVREAAVRDGNVITSRAAGTAAAFGLAVLAALAGEDAAEAVRESTLF
jgi:4-methyl-5(b-hydroxyethyl)-thiazole monophosphate biosynthesis